MVRIILGAIAGFIVWTLLWVGGDAIFMAISTYYQDYMQGFQKALESGLPFELSPMILLLTLLKSFVCSLISGFVAASIARESVRSTLILGVLLLAFGIFIQSVYWNYIPLWYHVSFLLLLVPVTFLGGKLWQPRLNLIGEYR